MPRSAEGGEIAHQDEVEDDYCVLDARVMLLGIFVSANDLSVGYLIIGSGAEG